MIQLKELLAMILIGDGVLGTLIPARHLRRWEARCRSGPIEVYARQPALTRCLAGAELALGVWYALRLSKADAR